MLQINWAASEIPSVVRRAAWWYNDQWIVFVVRHQYLGIAHPVWCSTQYAFDSRKARTKQFSLIYSPPCRIKCPICIHFDIVFNELRLWKSLSFVTHVSAIHLELDDSRIHCPCATAGRRRALPSTLLPVRLPRLYRFRAINNPPCFASIHLRIIIAFPCPGVSTLRWRRGFIYCLALLFVLVFAVLAQRLDRFSKGRLELRTFG